MLAERITQVVLSQMQEMLNILKQVTGVQWNLWKEEKCKQCLLCYPVCPDTSILVNEEGKRVDFDFDHCKGCGVCVEVCPFKAIDFVEED